MIPDIYLKAVIIPFFTALLSIPAWVYANPAETGDNTQTAGTSSGTPAAETAAMAPPALPHVNSLESTPRKMVFIPLNHVFFEHNKAALNERSKNILDDAARYVQLSNNIKRIIIYGHANSIASKEYNNRLSDKRANTVKNYLLKKKIPAELVWVMGWGEDDPLDENWTHRGSQRNRRVEIYMVQYSPQE